VNVGVGGGGVVVGVSVGVFVGVDVGVWVGVLVAVGVLVGVLVGVCVAVGVLVGVCVGVKVGVGMSGVGVLVGVFVGVGQGVPPQAMTSVVAGTGDCGITAAMDQRAPRMSPAWTSRRPKVRSPSTFEPLSYLLLKRLGRLPAA
jgi:hypothetical protein